MASASNEVNAPSGQNSGLCTMSAHRIANRSKIERASERDRRVLMENPRAAAAKRAGPSTFQPHQALESEAQRKPTATL